jgi:hypothetical protein
MQLLRRDQTPSPARIQTPGHPAHSLDTIMTMLPWLSHMVVLKSNFKVKGKKALWRVASLEAAALTSTWHGIHKDVMLKQRSKSKREHMHSSSISVWIRPGDCRLRIVLMRSLRQQKLPGQKVINSVKCLTDGDRLCSGNWIDTVPSFQRHTMIAWVSVICFQLLLTVKQWHCMNSWHDASICMNISIPKINSNQFYTHN